MRKKVSTRKNNRQINKKPISEHARKLVLVKHPLLRKLRIVKHKHTGKLVHHAHTSYVLLLFVLLLSAILTYINVNIAGAATIVDSGSVSVGVLVTGPPPSTGAEIVSPVEGETIKDDPIVTVSGTCAIDTYVIIRDNGVVVGSTECSATGIFSLDIQLSEGQNDLTAMNYDNYDQPGPVTPAVVVYFKNKKPPKTIPPEILPETPIYVPGTDGLIADFTEDDGTGNVQCPTVKISDLPASDSPRIAVICAPRIVNPEKINQLGLIVWGGEPPYAVSIDFSDGKEPKLISFEEPGYKSISFSYAVPGAYKVITRVADNADENGYLEMIVRVSGETETNTVGAMKDSLLEMLAFATVPIYLVVVAIVFAFWAGDLFDHLIRPVKKRHSH